MLHPYAVSSYQNMMKEVVLETTKKCLLGYHQEFQVFIVKYHLLEVPSLVSRREELVKELLYRNQNSSNNNIR
jgi:hypothetical protein